MPIIFQTRSETQTPIRKNTLRGSWRAVRVHRRREVGPRRPESVGERSRSGSAKIGRAPKTDRGGCIPRIPPPLCPMQNVFVRPSTSPESARTTPKRENDRRRPMMLFGVRLVPVASGAPHQTVFWLVKNVFGEVIVNFFIEEKCVHIIVYSIESLQCICNISLG